MKKIILLIMGLSLSIFAGSRSKTDDDPKQKELELLKSKIEASRNALQEEIAERWKKKQRYIKQREVDKEEQSRLQDLQARVSLELSHAKEECFTRERSITDELTELEKKKEGWKYISKTVEEVLSKEGNFISDLFPLDREDRRKDLEKIRREFGIKKQLMPTMTKFIDYRIAAIENGSSLKIEKKSLIPEGESAQKLEIARFGNVFCYGINSENNVYTLHQTGRLGSNRFAINRITASILEGSIQSLFPNWINAQKPGGSIPIDVLQNGHSNALISGEKIGMGSKLSRFIKAGGPVMVPLLILPFWALVLVIFKLIQFARKHRDSENLSKKVLEDIDGGKIKDALDYAGKEKGVVAKVVTTCLQHSEWDRDSAEKSVKAILVEELPLLNNHLNTLAVIAGVAPLLGLLGTVSGMISLFEMITNYGTGDPKIMAGGISEALITTQTGLTIAIPILLLHNYIRNRRDSIKADMEKNAIQILNRLWPFEKK